MLEQELLTPEEAARYMRVSVHSVYEWLRAGRLKGAKAGRWWRITPDDIEAFLVACAGDRQ